MLHTVQHLCFTNKLKLKKEIIKLFKKKKKKKFKLSYNKNNSTRLQLQVIYGYKNKRGHLTPIHSVLVFHITSGIYIYYI